MTTEETLQQLVRSTAAFSQAVEAGDLSAAGVMLAARGKVLGELQPAAAKAALTPSQWASLDQIARQGQTTIRTLIALRETLRARLGETETLRRQLSRWAPRRPDSTSRLDVSA